MGVGRKGRLRYPDMFVDDRDCHDLIVEDFDEFLWYAASDYGVLNVYFHEHTQYDNLLYSLVFISCENRRLHIPTSTDVCVAWPELTHHLSVKDSQRSLFTFS